MIENSLVLTGLSGAGKSTVGPLVADAAGLPFVDLDQAIVRRAGMAIDAIFDKLGEDTFRRLEREVLTEHLAGPPVVMATGAGALVDSELRAHALSRATVVWLQVGPETAADRVARSEARPLLADDPVGRLRALLDRRRGAYSEAHLRIETDGRSAAAVAADVLGALSALQSSSATGGRL